MFGVFQSEKVKSSDEDHQNIVTSIYEEFKHRRGYSQREIARKKEALMNVLVPLTETDIRGFMRDAGFGHSEVKSSLLEG